MYTRLPVLAFIVIYTAAVRETNRLYTRLPGFGIKLLFPLLYWLYTRLPGTSIKLIFTREPFKINTAVGVSIFLNSKRLPGVSIQMLFTRQPFKSHLRYIYTAAVCLFKIVILRCSRLYTLLQDVTYSCH